MYFDVIAAEYLGDYKLKIIFADGKSGVVDFVTFIKKGGVFEKLEDQKLFREFKLNHELGVITWGAEIDIAPETLYSSATQEPLPQWVEKPGLRKTA